MNVHCNSIISAKGIEKSVPVRVLSVFLESDRAGARVRLGDREGDGWSRREDHRRHLAAGLPAGREARTEGHEKT